MVLVRLMESADGVVGNPMPMSEKNPAIAGFFNVCFGCG